METLLFIIEDDELELAFEEAVDQLDLQSLHHDGRTLAHLD